ncbi:MAG: cytochrome b/b6 domain-containing protein [Pseudomonadota bacterium]
MSVERYNSVAVVLHWAIAILIIGQIAGGFYMHNLPNSSPIKFDLYQLHKSFGLSVLALSLARLGWRLAHRPPALPASVPGWQQLAARATHWAFYALMILTPLAGWAMVSVSPVDIPTKLFGIIPVPHLPFFEGVSDREAAEESFKERHEFLAKLIIGLLVLHVAAALKHVFVDKDGVMKSMTPARAGQWIGIGAIFAALGAGGLMYLTASGPQANAAPSSASAQNDGAPVAQSGNWVVDYDASTLSFSGSEKGNGFTGQFNDFTADITFDPEDFEGSSIVVTVATASASTGDSLRDSTIPGEEWFNVESHPTAVFSTSSIRDQGDGYQADGALKIKDFQRPVTLAFDLSIDGEKAVATGGADLIRTEFGLGQNDAWLDEEGVALEVRVEFEIHATKQN